jgi:hypothetical protein
MIEDTLLPFSLPSVQRKKVTAAFDGGRMTSDGGVMLLAAIETSKGSMKGKLKRAGWNDAFLTQLLAAFATPQMR